MRKKTLNNKIIASLTSYGVRINTVSTAIRSILDQTLKADKLILWLSQDEFNIDNIPDSLKQLQNSCFEILFCEDIKSYKKLIPTLKKYPNDVVITFDDDIVYKKDIIEKLVKSYKKYPNVIHCVRGHKILFEKNSKIKSYNDWELLSNDFSPGFNVFPTGGAGALYPPNCFYKDISNKNTFLNLAPCGDDIWFKAMTLKQGLKCKIVGQSNNEYMKLNYIDGTQKNGLWLNNLDEEKGNNLQIKRVFKKYNLMGLLQNSRD